MENLKIGQIYRDSISRPSFFFEIGDIDSLPPNNLIADQVRKMALVDAESSYAQVMPEIKLAEATELDPQKIALQTKLIKEVAANLPQGDAERGHKIFNDVAKSLCLTCHVMGERGVKFGPDLTGIGSIRSAQDLLEDSLIAPNQRLACLS